MPGNVPGEDQSAKINLARGQLELGARIHEQCENDNADEERVCEDTVHGVEEAGKAIEKASAIGQSGARCERDGDHDQGDKEKKPVAGSEPSPGAGEMHHAQGELADLE